MIPGLTYPSELMMPLIAGLISVLVGVGCIWQWKKDSNRKFHKLAEKLLAGTKRPWSDTTDTSLLVRFTTDGMMLPNDSIVLYQEFQTIIEAKHIYFLVWLDKVTILQKKDIVEEVPETFAEFLEEMTGLTRVSV